MPGIHLPGAIHCVYVVVFCTLRERGKEINIVDKKTEVNYKPAKKVRGVAVVVIMVLAFCAYANAQPEVEIADQRDENGKFVNATALAVAWDMEADGTTFKEYPLSDVPDHNSRDDDSIQDWYVKTGADVFWKFTFTRTTPGEYAVRWRPSPDAALSDWGVCVISIPDAPIHGD